MATFVHLAPADRAARIRRGGIRALSHGRGSGLGDGRGVYLFPVLPSYTLTHQWLRELSRRPGSRELVAVHVRLPDGEAVTVGRYGDREPEETTAAGAVGRLGRVEDPRGWEVFLPRPVARGEIRHLRAVRQVNGWRYFPGAHGVTPCTCAGCRVPGGYGSRRLRERRPHPDDGPAPAPRVLLARVERAVAAGDTAALCEALRGYGLRRRGPVARLARLSGHPDPQVRRLLARAVASWSTPGVDGLLRELAGDAETGVRQAVAETVAYRPTPEAGALLAELAGDPASAVREAVVEGLAHRETPEADALLRRLAHDPDAGVRELVELFSE
ncbi:HEAT repeat domain-containing protein [Streptomyces sp. NPDC053493]|uniref:HEAT repeat domain-containing protein n=1 Tax=Streptomyces sp. NPDC053493 TaxID=3365705 RepID=UPI0037D91D8C